jgi:LysR family transcriptional regulator, benzoate and cis,cis-muconate-responsive activator of ben and cat genes
MSTKFLRDTTTDSVRAGGNLGRGIGTQGRIVKVSVIGSPAEKLDTEIAPSANASRYRVPGLNIKQLRYFLAVATELNFTRAAERVGIAQPPLSQQIIALERELGTQLFVRGNRQVQLTRSGEVLVEHARRVINSAASAVDAVRRAQRGAVAHIKVGAIYSAIYSFLPATIRDFAEGIRDAGISLQEMTISQQINALKEGIIEIGLLRGPIYEHDLRTETLYRERLVAALPASCGRTSGKPISMRELAEYPLIAVTAGSRRGYSDGVFAAFEAQDVRPKVAHEVSDMHTGVCLVAAGLGVSVVPAIMQLMQTKGVIYCPLAEPTPGTSFALALRYTTASPSIDHFMKSARKTAQALQKAHPDLFMTDVPE